MDVVADERLLVGCATRLLTGVICTSLHIAAEVQLFEAYPVPTPMLIDSLELGRQCGRVYGNPLRMYVVDDGVRSQWRRQFVDLVLLGRWSVTDVGHRTR